MNPFSEIKQRECFFDSGDDLSTHHYNVDLCDLNSFSFVFYRMSKTAAAELPW